MDRDSDGTFDTLGGVHGELWELAPAQTVLRRNDAGPALATDASWGRLFVQAVVDGDPATMQLQDGPGPLD